MLYNSIHNIHIGTYFILKISAFIQVIFFIRYIKNITHCLIKSKFILYKILNSYFEQHFVEYITIHQPTSTPTKHLCILIPGLYGTIFAQVFGTIWV